MKIAVAGTGYVGMSIATLLAQHNEVVAVDVIPEKVEKINNKVSPIQDDYIEKYLAEKELDLKAMIKEERPDHSDNQSFPSGHAAMAFAAARSIDKEFRKDCIWIPIAGYAAATAIGIERVASDRHHWYDVMAGAAVGYGAAELTWWLSDKMFGKGSNVAVGSSGNTLDVVYNF